MRQQQRRRQLRPPLDADGADAFGDGVTVDGAAHDGQDDDGTVAVGAAAPAAVGGVAANALTCACMLGCHKFVPVALVSVVLSIEAMPTNVATRAYGLWHTVTLMWEMWQIVGRAEV